MSTRRARRSFVDAYFEHVPAELASAVREAEFVCPEYAILVDETDNE